MSSRQSGLGAWRPTSPRGGAQVFGPFRMPGRDRVNLLLPCADIRVTFDGFESNRGESSWM